MKGMLLCAGYGSRLVPLTKRRAKPAIPFLNKPFLIHLLEALWRHGIADFVVNLHHLPETITALSPLFPSDVNVSFTEEKDRILGTAGGLKKAEQILKGDTFFLLNSDIFFSIDLMRVLRFHRKAGALATLVLKKNSDPEAFPAVVLDRQNRVIQIASRPEGAHLHAETSAFMFTGIHVLEPEIFSHIPGAQPFEINRDVYPTMLRQKGPVYGYVTEELWCEAGTLSRFLVSTRAALKAMEHAGALVARETEIGEDAHIGSGCVIGPGSRISPEARITDSVLLENVQVGHEAVIENAILDEGVTVKPGQRVKNVCISLDPEGGEETLVEIPGS